MKKYIKGLLLLVLTLSFINLPRGVEAKDDLTIPNWVVDASLFEDGKLQISEDITFEFNTDFNGVYREIMLNKTAGVTGIIVQEVVGDQGKEYKQVKTAKNGDSGVYTIKENSSKIQIKIFSPSEDEVKTFRISYFVNNVAVKYNDIGELYYKFLGDENETAIGKFTVNIYLPMEDTENKVKLFAHGPSNGKTSKKSNTFYQLEVEKVPANTLIEARILFPREFIELSENLQSIDKYDQIIQEENTNQRRRIEAQEGRNRLSKVFNSITLGASFVALGLFVWIYLQSRRKISIPTNYDYTRLPQDCTPAIAAQITGVISGSNVLFATILDLFRKGYLRISGEQENYGMSDQNFVLTKTKEPDSTLLSHESYFMNWLFKDMGDGRSITTEGIKYYSKHNNSKFIHSYSSWKSKVKLDADQKGYYEKSKTKQGTILLALSALLILIGIITAIYDGTFALLGFAVAVPLLIYSLVLFNRLSEYGYGEYTKWAGFIKYSKNNYPDFTKEAVIQSLDVSLIYAFALNLVKKTTTSARYTESYSANSWIFWYFLFINTDNNTFKKSMDDSFHGAFVSSDTGGFSAGGGGGAGGGGAGGF